MDFPLRCRCGSVEGRIAEPARGARAICYCRDCQAYARYLGEPERTLDAAGGTDIVATTPERLHFTRGQDQLRCVTLTEKGPLRWYAQCCRTPIANTPRSPKLPYAGVVHDCLAGSAAEIDAAFGAARAAVNTESAKKESGHAVSSTPVATFAALLRIVRNVAGARLSGRWRANPFFRADSSKPLVPPQTLSPEERRALYDGV